MISKILLFTFGSLLVFSQLFAQTVKQVYWADNSDQRFYKAGIDGSNVTTLWSGGGDEAKPNIKEIFPGIIPMDIDVDFTNGIVYGIEANGQLFKCNLDGSGLATIGAGVSDCFALALDKVNGKLYFTTSQASGDIYSIDTGFQEQSDPVLTDIGIPIYAIAVDPASGKIYFSTGANIGAADLSISGKSSNSAIMNGFSSSSIYRADLDGQNYSRIVDNQYDVGGLDLDLTNGKIYWTNFATARSANKNIVRDNFGDWSGEINKSDLDGTNVVNILSNLEQPFGISLDVAMNKLYFTKSTADNVANLSISSENNKVQKVHFDPRQILSANLDGTGVTVLFNVANPFGIQVEVGPPPANQPPVVVTNTGATVDEGGTLTITNTMLNSTDPDGNTYLVYMVTQPPINGEVRNNGTALGLYGTFLQTDINGSKVTYVHNGTETTSDSFGFEVTDNANATAPGETFLITVNPVNALPVLANMETTELDYILGSPEIQPTATLEVTDADNTDLASATVEIGNYFQGEDFLTFTDTDFITHTFDAATGILTLTGPATVSQFQAALRAVSFTSLGVQSINTQKIITFMATDGTGTSLPAERVINVDLPTGTAAGLTAPSNIHIVFNPDGTVTVSWNDNSGSELGFIIYRQTPGSSKLSIVNVFNTVGVTGSNSSHFSDENATEGVEYSYKVATFNASGIIDGEEVVLTKTLIPPSTLEAVDDMNEHVILTWNDNSGIETGYKVERDGGSGFLEIADLEAGIETYMDETFVAGGTYSYRVKAYNNSSESEYSNIVELITTDVEEWDQLVPKNFTLEQNYPNPFNPNTIIRYGLPEDSHVRIIIYNMIGQKVTTLVDQTMSAGYHEITFDASGINSGIYLYKLEAGNFIEIKKCILMK